MNVQALSIHLGARRIGVLFRYELAPDTVTTRFVADDDFARDPLAPTLSISFMAPTPEQQAALWADTSAGRLNGSFSARQGWMLPPFFQNLLPEGALRERLAEIRGCDPKDHFELLSATGADLPGNVYALPVELTREELARYVTQGKDALEPTVMADPLDQGVSVSGVQPKMGALKEGEHYVARTRLKDAHVIVKLPVIGFPLLPELEHLSLQLARAAGARVVESTLVSMEQLKADHGYDLGEANARTKFLAVQRYDRDAQPMGTAATASAGLPASFKPGRVHAEDFAQILVVQPERKYSLSYLDVAATMLALPSLGEAAVLELLQRIFINELLGNPDMHLKNIGVLYPDGHQPVLPPAYDIVAYAAYGKRLGRALSLFPQAAREAKPRVNPQDVAARDPREFQMGPADVRRFCSQLGIPEKPATTLLSQTAKAAYATWPALVASSGISDKMKQRLLEHFHAHRAIESLNKRATA